MNIFKIESTNRKWYHIIGWWELRRILFNTILFVAGISSFYIAYITIPLLYEVIALGLNLFYTLGWIVEIAIIKNIRDEKAKVSYPKYAFAIFTILSIIFVLGFAVSLHWKLILF